MDAVHVENVGGYRLIRKLGDGERAEVWLGHSAIPPDNGSAGAVIAVKLYRPHVTQRSIDGEIEALARASSPHVVALLDLASTADGRPCLILERLPQSNLERLFNLRQVFSAGELVTAIAPVTAAVAELHRLGITHGGIRASAIFLNDRRAPVLACFGASRVIGDAPTGGALHSLTGAQRASDDSIAADIESLADLIRSFAGRVESPEPCTALLEWLEAKPRGEDTLAELTDRLFDSADAVPLADSDPPNRSVSFATRSAGSMVPALPVPLDSTTVRQARLMSGDSPFGVELVRIGCARVAAWLAAAITEGPGKTFAARLKEVAGTVRRPVWIAAAIGAVSLVVAIGVIPSLATASPSPRMTTTPEEKRAALSEPRPSMGSAIDSDDPTSAAGALVAARERCIVERSIGCLEKVEQAESAALEADSFYLRQLKDGVAVKQPKLDNVTITVVERLGDSAIVGLGEPTAPGTYPASILIVKVGKSWRIRDLTTGVSP